MSTIESGISSMYKSGSINTSSSDYNQESDQVGTRLKDALEHGIDKSIREITMKEAESLVSPDIKVGEGCFGACYKAEYEIKGKTEKAVAKHCNFTSINELACLLFEINTVGSFKHRHIAKLHCYAKESDKCFQNTGKIILIMEDWSWLGKATFYIAMHLSIYNSLKRK